MQQEMLKTSFKQRLIIILIAALLLGSSIAVYVAIIVNGGNSNSGSTKLDSIIAEYTSKQNEIASSLSGTYLDKLVKYKSEIKGFNAASANSGGVKTRDIVVGSGSTISEEDRNYYAYYIGYCADETIFDSSFDDAANPSSLKVPIEVATTNLIEGWTKGMVGAKIGGVREITIPSSLAYQEEEICGAANSPLRFVVLTFTPSEDILKKYDELEEIYGRYVQTYYEQYADQLTSGSSDSASEGEE